MLYKSALPSYDVYNKRVIVRADLNVPLNNSFIIDDYRLQALVPTIDLILKKNGLITLLTHIGRPKSREKLLSTQLLMQWFTNHNYTISWATSIDQARELIKNPELKIVLLENLRFHPEEKTQDYSFAQKLSTLGDFYVNDAFGALHRNDTSITILPTFFSPDHRTIGLLVEKELNTLAQLINHPEQPFVIIVGGGKVKDKLPVIENLLHHAHTILLCPAIAATFLKSMGENVGKSLVDDAALPLCADIMNKARKNNVQILLPTDYLIAHKTIEGRLETVAAKNFPDNGIALSIGPKTIEEYASHIYDAKTIFFNAAMGFLNIQESCKGTQALLQAIAQSPALSVIGGGDSVAAARQSGLAHAVSFLSTGGGATLAYLSGKKLPGLYALYNNEELNK